MVSQIKDRKSNRKKTIKSNRKKHHKSNRKKHHKSNRKKHHKSNRKKHHKSNREMKAGVDPRDMKLFVLNLKILNDNVKNIDDMKDIILTEILEMFEDEYGKLDKHIFKRVVKKKNDDIIIQLTYMNNDGVLDVESVENKLEQVFQYPEIYNDNNVFDEKKPFIAVNIATI
jgi:hypothetical protein